ncbi:MAG: hypothetical protein E6Q97_38690 [Desulfurellales bacterium]|nr:MAG: hypothetical protein E6Q97_38690 [Desulfurellales bacterium]
MKSSTEMLASALDKLSAEIQTDDGVVNACLREAAERLRELASAGNELLECAAQPRWTRADNPYYIRKAEQAVARWKGVVK